MNGNGFGQTTVPTVEVNVSMGECYQPMFSITEENYHQMSFYINVIVTPVVCVFGVCGNVLGVGVLWTNSRQHRLTVYIYMCSLTLCDALYLFFGLLRSIPHIVKIYDAYRANFVEEHMKLGTIYIDVVLTYTSTHLVIVMAAERLYALIRPFTVKYCFLSRYPKTVISAIIALNMIFFVPLPLSFEVSSVTNIGHRTEYFLRFKPSSQPAMDRYMVIQTVVYNYIPAVILLVINISIPIAYSGVFKSRRSDLRMTRDHGRRQIKITLMVLCITIMYLLFSLSDLFIKTLGFINSDYSFGGKYELVFWFFTDITNLLMYLNAANDFVIYILVSDHYRKILVRMYCSCFYSKKATLHRYSRETLSTVTKFTDNSV